jgi:16S rRNA processing protein RimM
MERTSGTPHVLTNPMPEDADSWAWLARLRHPQGRKGEILAEILTDFPEKFAERRQLWLVAPNSPANHPPEARPVELMHHWLHKGGVVLHFAGVDSISAAELLCGLMVAIPQTERVQLGEDEAYIGDLIGCQLIDLAGPEPVCLGPIEEVDRTAGPVALLVVRGKQGELLVPFAKSYLRKIDLANKRLEMVLPEGLAELNG